jgi:hypothetical protein
LSTESKREIGPHALEQMFYTPPSYG